MYHKTRPHYPITKLVRKKGQTVAICFANGWTPTSALKRRCTFRAGSAPPGRSKRRGSAHKGLTVSPCWPRCKEKMSFNLANTTHEVQANCSQEKSIICIYIIQYIYIYYILDYIWPIHVVVYYRTNGPSLLGKAGWLDSWTNHWVPVFVFLSKYSCHLTTTTWHVFSRECAKGKTLFWVAFSAATTTPMAVSSIDTLWTCGNK